jgi:hypothetical protein
MRWRRVEPQADSRKIVAGIDDVIADGRWVNA